MKILAVLFAVFALFSAAQATIPWPFAPFTTPLPIGNSYGEYQDYGGAPYLHPGIDIRQPAGSAVYAVKSGWVKAILTTSAEYHWRVAIGDAAGADSCDGWLYAHLEQSTIAVSVGQHVDSGQFLGNIVSWPVAGFHHCHFVKIRGAGLTWSSDWLFVGNPLDELVNITDLRPPYFVDISPGVPFRFCVDNTAIFFGATGPISGNVDIVAHAHDIVGDTSWVLAPYAMGYEIYSDSVYLGPYTSFTFTGKLNWDQVPNVIYKADFPCQSAGDYDYREFYEIITNHDSNPEITTADALGNWPTAQIPNDLYTVKVWAKDRFGNVTWDSMKISTLNFHNISGTLIFNDGNPYGAGGEISTPYTSSPATTASDGTFSLLGQPAGRYLITAAKPGYQSKANIYTVLSSINIPIVLDPLPYVDGDVDFSGGVDISDAVYLISFIFTSGPPPIPWGSGTNIDDSPSVDISDVVYIISYIFGGGPPPGA